MHGNYARPGIEPVSSACKTVLCGPIELISSFIFTLLRIEQIQGHTKVLYVMKMK